MIEFGIDYFGNVRFDDESNTLQTPASRMQEILKEVQLMDEVGLDFFGMGEHHRIDYAVSAPEIFLAAASSVTKNIRLSSSVSVISSADPVKLFQDFAMLDLLSDGRAEIMAGRGSFTESFPLFGYDLRDYNDLFEEKLELLLQLNQEKNITWSGKFRKPLQNQDIYPRPKNDKLPIWVAVGGTPESVIRAGRLGLPVMLAIIGGSPRNFLPLIDLYKRVWIESGHAVEDFRLGTHVHSFFGHDSHAVTDRHFPIYAKQMNNIGKSRGWSTFERSTYDRGRQKEGHLVVGDPEEAAEKIVHIVKTLGLTRFCAHMDTGTPDHKDMLESIEVYGSKIIPLVKKELAGFTPEF